MGEMKSAWQIAMEKADKLGKVSQDELNTIKYVPEGNRIASQFLIDDKMDLSAEIAKIQPAESAPFVKKGVEEILLRNIGLPRNDEEQRRTNRSMAGLQEHQGKQEAARIDLRPDQQSRESIQTCAAADLRRVQEERRGIRSAGSPQHEAPARRPDDPGTETTATATGRMATDSQ